MKILLVSDVLNGGPLHNTCIAIKKYIPEYKFEIVAGAAKRINEPVDKYDLIHFLFTAGLTANYDFVMKHGDKIIITLVNERSLLDGFGVDVKKLKK
jgi:type IV secretory pathway VirB6-like protein